MLKQKQGPRLFLRKRTMNSPLPGNAKAPIKLRDWLIFAGIIVACHVVVIVQNNFYTAFIYILIAYTCILYLCLLYFVYKAIQHPERNKLKGTASYQAVLLITLIDLFFFGTSYKGFLLALTVVLFIFFVILIYLRSLR